MACFSALWKRQKGLDCIMGRERGSERLGRLKYKICRPGHWNEEYEASRPTGSCMSAREREQMWFLGWLQWKLSAWEMHMKMCSSFEML